MSKAINNKNAFIAYLAISIMIIIIDQLSKIWVLQNIPLHHAIPVVPYFSLVHAHNYGAAFGFLNNAGGWQTIFFSGIAFVVSGVLLVWLCKIAGQARQLSLALSLVLGGAVGNLIDRVQYQYVVDFLLFYYQQWQFPAFNVADAAISIGAILLLMDSFEWKLIPDKA